MLPDCPELKAEIRDHYTLLLRIKINNYLGFVAEIPKSHIFEGNSNAIERPTGEVELTKMARLGADFTVKYEEVPYLTHERIMQRLDEVAFSMAKQMSKHFFETISEATERVGNVVNAKGKPLSAEIVLDLLEKMWLPFDDNHNPKLPSIVIGSGQIDRMKIVNEELETNQALKNRFTDIINRKREEWLAGEADRKLVG